MVLEVKGNTHTGKVREHNEDAYLISGLNKHPGFKLLLVSDGVGGKQFGEVASQTVIDTFNTLLADNLLDAATQAEMAEPLLEMAARRCHGAIGDKGREHKVYQGMSCTLVAALCDPQGVSFVNVGDSRLYHWSEGYICQVSQDQTMAWALVREGRLKEEDIDSHPNRNVLVHALGVESLDHPLEVIAGQFDWQPGDRLLLCSDGLTDMVDDATIEHLLAKPAAEAVDALIDAALEAGGRDNVTVIVCENRLP